MFHERTAPSLLVMALSAVCLLLIFLFGLALTPDVVGASVLNQCLVVFVATALVYLGCAAGYVDTMDACPSIDTALALWERRSFLTYPREPHPDTYHPGPNGGWYTKVGLAMPLLYLGPVILAGLLAQWSRTARSVWTDFLVSFVNAFVTAATIALLCFCFHRQGRDATEALFLSFAAGFCTLLFPYSKTAQREPLQGLCLLGAVAFSEYGVAEEPALDFFLAGCFVGFGFLTKLALAVPLFPLFLLGLTRCLASREPAGSVVAFILPVIGAAVFWMLFSRTAYGNPLRSGYSAGVHSFHPYIWRTPFWKGIYRQLLSPDTGLLFHDPVAAFALISLVAQFALQTGGELPAVLLAAVFLQLSLYAKWCNPTGDVCLGPRYLVPAIPLLMVALPRVPTGLWVSASILQFINVSIKPQQYWTMRWLARHPLRTPHWLANLKIFLHKCRLRPEQYRLSRFGCRESKSSVDLSPFFTLRGFNFWWWHAWQWKKNKGQAP